MRHRRGAAERDEAELKARVNAWLVKLGEKEPLPEGVSSGLPGVEELLH